MYVVSHYKNDMSGTTLEDKKEFTEFAIATDVVKNKAKLILSSCPYSSIQNQTFTKDQSEIHIITLGLTHHIVLTKTDL